MKTPESKIFLIYNEYKLDIYIPDIHIWDQIEMLSRYLSRLF